MHLNWLVKILPIMTRIVASSSQCVNKSPKISHLTNREAFQLHYLSLIERQDKSTALQTSAVFGRVNTLADKWCFETGPFRHLSNHVFSESKVWEIHKLWDSAFLSKCSKFYVAFKNAII